MINPTRSIVAQTGVKPLTTMTNEPFALEDAQKYADKYLHELCKDLVVYFGSMRAERGAHLRHLDSLTRKVARDTLISQELSNNIIKHRAVGFVAQIP